MPLRKYMFKAFHLLASYISMCLQTCGSGLIGRSAALSNAMIWGSQRELAGSRSALINPFSFLVVKNRNLFPAADSLPEIPAGPASRPPPNQAAAAPRRSLRLLSVYERCIVGTLKGKKGPYLHGSRPHFRCCNGLWVLHL